MSDLKKLGMNIRSVREAYGESQEELGFVLGVGKNTISYYETGQREPKKETLIKIARHYMVPVESLLYGSFTNRRKLIFNGKVLLKNLDIIFPIVSSENAINNKYFKKAFDAQQSFYNACKEKEDIEFDWLDGSIDDYYLKAAEDERLKEETTVNQLAMYFLMFLAIKSIPFIIEEKPATINMLDDNMKKEIEYSDDIDPEIKDLVSEISSDETKKMITDMLVTVKQSKKWSDLAYYYSALQFFFNLVDNRMDVGSNIRVGSEMLSSFAEINNPYAISFMEICFSSFLPESSSQSVDDKE